MDKDKAQEPLVVPDWVKGLFKDVSSPSPTQNPSPVDRDALSLSMASEEVTSGIASLEIFKDSPQKLERIRKRVFEAFITLGLLYEAERFADTPEQKAKLLSIKSALEMPDDQFCDCQDDKAGNILLSRMRTIRRIYRPDHKQFVDIKQCRKCLWTNATDIKTDTEAVIAQKVAKAGEGDSDEKVFR